MDDDLRGLCGILRSGGIERPEWEARQIFRAGQSDKERQIMAWRRASGEPLAHVLGEWDFYGLTLKLSKDTLIPRPETETLVDKALEALRGKGGGADVLDLCCGSGCIGLAVASEHPPARVTLLDISEGALETARENSKKFAHVSVGWGDALSDPPETLQESFDLLLCNPPYISAEEWDGLERSVRDYEPRLALFGGEGGLDFYRAVASRWRSVLRPGGLLLFEIGYRQAKQVSKIMRDQNFENIETFQDIGSRDRVVAGQKQ